MTCSDWLAIAFMALFGSFVFGLIVGKFIAVGQGED